MWRTDAGGQERKEESHHEAPEPGWVKGGARCPVSCGGGGGAGGGGVEAVANMRGQGRPQGAPARPTGSCSTLLMPNSVEPCGSGNTVWKSWIHM